MRFSAFLRLAYPPLTVFDRKDRGLLCNTAKWLGLRAAYVLLHLGVTANILSLMSVSLLLIGSICLSLYFPSWPIVVLGNVLIWTAVWIDFVDGAIARAQNRSSVIGGVLDNFAMELARVLLVTVFAFYAGSPIAYFVAAFSSAVVIFLVKATVPALSYGKYKPIVTLLYDNPLSPISVRVMVFVMPAVISTLSFLDIDPSLFGRAVLAVYFILAIFWLILCIPHHRNEINLGFTEKKH